MALYAQGTLLGLSLHPLKRLLLVLLALGMLSCGSDLPPADEIELSRVEPKPARHVILLSLDTFRADAAGWLGDPANSDTPALDKFALDAVVFERARVQIPFTQPSHMSMFTGLYPIVHRVNGESARLHSGIATLPVLLQEQGFSTHGFYVNYWMKGSYGFGRGFDQYDLIEGDATHANHLNTAAFAAIEKVVDEGRSLFLFVQYFDPHSDDKQQNDSSLPYYSPPEFRREIEIADPDAEFCDDQQHCATQFIQWADLAKRDVSPNRVAEIRALYDAGIRYLDSELGKLFEKLETLGIYDDALIIVTSDHGEEFREHGKFLHSRTYEESIAVPLLIKFPARAYAGEHYFVLAESVDLMPTVLDQLGVEIPDGLQGKSLLPSITSGARLREYSFSQDKARRRRFSLSDERHKLIYDTKLDVGQLFDLVQDPREQVDLSKARPQLLEAMKTELRMQLANYRKQASMIHKLPDEAPGTGLSEEEKQRLRGIGYLVE